MAHNNYYEGLKIPVKGVSDATNDGVQNVLVTVLYSVLYYGNVVVSNAMSHVTAVRDI